MKSKDRKKKIWTRGYEIWSPTFRDTSLDLSTYKQISILVRHWKNRLFRCFYNENYVYYLVAFFNRFPRFLSKIFLGVLQINFETQITPCGRMRVPVMMNNDSVHTFVYFSYLDRVYCYAGIVWKAPVMTHCDTGRHWMIPDQPKSGNQFVIRGHWNLYPQMWYSLHSS